MIASAPGDSVGSNVITDTSSGVFSSCAVMFSCLIAALTLKCIRMPEYRVDRIKYDKKEEPVLISGGSVI